VSVSSFAISKYDLTFGEYDAYCAATGAAKPNDQGWGRGPRPVINVSWYDAVAYCNWRSQQDGKRPAYTISGTNVSCDFSANGYRLPTEAEWEYAAKGGPAASSLALNAVYAGSADLDAMAWYGGNSGKTTHPVGQKVPNSLGLYDMSGNVYEWCWDWDGSYSAGSQSDPTGASSGDHRVIRGGSQSEDYAGYLRSARRNSNYPNNWAPYMGFRLVLLHVGARVGAEGSSPCPRRAPSDRRRSLRVTLWDRLRSWREIGADFFDKVANGTQNSPCIRQFLLGFRPVCSREDIIVAGVSSII
jgi:formylglycine-generating enzyme